MKQFIGTKILLAVAMTRAEYCAYRGWELPGDEDGEDEGMLVEYENGGEPNDSRHKGYISWSPLTVFEKTYTDTSQGMSFGMAIEAMKVKKKVCRKGWNRKGMWLKMVSKGNFDVGVDTVEEGSNLLPWIGMKTADNSFVLWLASQTDMLAQDWIVLN